MNNELNTHMHNWTNLSLCEKSTSEKHFRESMCEEKHFGESMFEEKHFGEMSERLSSCNFRKES